MAAGAVTVAVHLALMVAASAALTTFSVGIGTGMRDHLDASPMDAYIGNIQNVIAASVCKGISIRQQSQSLLTNFYIDSFLERAALELGFPVERHLSLKHAAALYRQGKLVRKDPLFCCNAV